MCAGIRKTNRDFQPESPYWTTNTNFSEFRVVLDFRVTSARHYGHPIPSNSTVLVLVAVHATHRQAPVLELVSPALFCLSQAPPELPPHHCTSFPQDPCFQPMAQGSGAAPHSLYSPLCSRGARTTRASRVPPAATARGQQ